MPRRRHAGPRLPATAAGMAGRPGTAPTSIDRPGHPAQPTDSHRPRPAPVRFLTAASIEDLPDATTQTVLSAAPVDQHPDRSGIGVLVHPRAPLPLFDNRGRPFCRIRPASSSGETWLPAIGMQPGWLRVLLPARPSGAYGWLDAARVTTAPSRHELRILPGTARLELLHDGDRIGSWTTSGGALPAHRTFVLAAVRRTPGTAPLLLRLAAHVRAGDPALITIHGARDDQVHTGGCIHVSDDAMTALDTVPAGCLVRIHPADSTKGTPL